MPAVTIVGGGLAGMIAALRLRQRGCDVVIIEAAERLGGQASARDIGGCATDHSYHIFPPWYANAWALIDELEMRDNFVASPNFSQLRQGDFPRFATFKNLTAPIYAVRNIFAGAMSPAQMFLFFYAIVDLMAQPYRTRAALDQVSVTGFLRSRWYRTLPAAEQMHDLVLKGLSTPLYGLSAMTMQTTMRHWVWRGVPSLHLTRSNLQESWIAPIEAALRRAGVEIRTGMEFTGLVLDGGVVAGIEVRPSGVPGSAVSLPVETLLLALPVGVICGFWTTDYTGLRRASPSCGGSRRCRWARSISCSGGELRRFRLASFRSVIRRSHFRSSISLTAPASTIAS